MDDSAPLNEALNQRWEIKVVPMSWGPFWKFLWSGWGLPQAQLILWRVLNHGYFTNHWGAIWGVTPDFCPICKLLGESTQDLFFDYEKFNQCWDLIDGCLRNTPLLSLVHGNLLQVLTKVVSRQRHCPTQLILLAEIIHTTWVECNQVAR